MAKASGQTDAGTWARLVAQGVLKALGGPYAAIAEAGWEGIEQALQDKRKDLHDPSADTKERGWILWREAMAATLDDVFRAGGLTHSLNETEFSGRVAAMVEQVAPAGASQQVTADDLREPRDFPPYKELRAAFPALLREIDPECPDWLIEAAPSRLDNSLGKGLLRARNADPAFYEALDAALTGPAAEGELRRAQWAKHHRWLHYRFAGRPLWFQESTGITLADLYVPPRAFRHFEKENEEAKAHPRSPHRHPERDRDRYRAELHDLHRAVSAWLTSDDPGDRLRVVGGGPGSGKSSFARRLAVDVSGWDGWRVLFVEVQGFGAVSDLEARVGQYLKQNVETGFDDDPLDWLPLPDDDRLLLIFDGLDELARPGEEDSKLMQRFAHAVQELLRLKAGQTARVKALLLGRPGAAAEALRETALAEDRLFTVAKLPPLDHEDAHVSEEDFYDPNGLAEQDQRTEYWTNWLRAKGKRLDTPCTLLNEGFGELTSEPILNYLLLISGYATPGADPTEAIDNRNRVYKTILAQLLPRKWGETDHPATHGLKEDDFFFLLECLGLAAWAGGGRVGDEKLFAGLRDCCATSDRRRRIGALPAAELRNVATTFYTREEGGYEFVHKSFGEYLTARGLLRFVRERLPILEDGSIDNALSGWLKIAGDAEIHSELIAFIRREARLCPPDALREHKDRLTRVMNAALAQGFPAHKEGSVLGITGGTDSTLRTCETRDRHATGALLAVLNAVARALAPTDREAALISFEWSDSRLEPYILLHRLRVLNIFRGTELHECLSHLCLKGAQIALAEFTDSDLSYSDLSHTNINLSQFDNAYLRSANLKCADALDVNLSRAILTGANLKSAALIKADLSDANLSDADLSGANLSGADLSGAVLSGGNLNGALLGGADLSGADLSGADLSDANLTEANLSGANLSGTELASADLSGVFRPEGDLDALIAACENAEEA